ncbi:MAG TPA: hypothetical protein VFB62_21995 [Polyangiaceae bacterium]|jgi:hypothetical protein|nr:hypothetical protein [Polyangiaceae bacterium]
MDCSDSLPDLDAVDALLDRRHLATMDADDRGPLLKLLATHPAPEVRERVLARVLEPQMLHEIDIELVDALLSDARHGVPWFAVAAFGRILRRLPGLDQLRIMSEWAISESRAHRLVLASAVARVKLASAESALNVLVDDADPTVRAVARRSRKHRASRRLS